jgi:hypothetical protein
MSDDDNDDWERLWDARKLALETVLGSSDECVLHAAMPLHLGGEADVLVFSRSGKGIAYVTADLTGELGESDADYELMICTPEESDWAPNIVSKLARYAIDNPLGSGETMDIGSAVPAPSDISALFFDTFATTEILGREIELRLCLGITGDELDFAFAHGTRKLVDLLKAQSVYPITDLKRTSVLLPE